MSQETTPVLSAELEAAKASMEVELEVYQPGIVCPGCDTPLPFDEAIQGLDEVRRCEECHDGRYGVCENCGNTVIGTQILDVHTMEGGTPGWCPKCRDEETFVCSHCCEVFYNDLLIGTSNGESLCSGCYQNHYFVCDECGRTLEEGDYARDGYCTRCDNDNSNDEGSEDEYGLRNYEDKTASRMGPLGKPKDGLYFGVELEVQSSSDCNRSRDVSRCLVALGYDFAVAKYDGSLSEGKGFEIVTCPATVAVHSERWLKLLSPPPTGLKSWNGYHCGMHVHASKAPISQLTMGKILVFVNSNENRDFIVDLAGREEREYAALYPKKVSDACGSTWHREAVNLANCDTVEFRIFRGTLKFLGFMKNLEFVEATIRFCQKAGLRELNVPSFGRFVAENRKQYPSLFDWLVENGYATKPQSRTKRSAAPCV